MTLSKTSIKTIPLIYIGCLEIQDAHCIRLEVIELEGCI